MAAPESLGIVFFDGDCGLCNRLVLFLLKRDRRKILRFAPLTGKMARQWLEDKDLQGETVIFLDDSGIYRKSEAVLRVLARLGGPWRIARAGLWTPRFLRDGVYDFISRRRRRWFGGGEGCPLPTSLSGPADGRLLS
jgi:predicted DCC family thiol-disulfide oxidoreductase YuxK